MTQSLSRQNRKEDVNRRLIQFIFVPCKKKKKKRTRQPLKFDQLVSQAPTGSERGCSMHPAAFLSPPEWMFH